MVTAILPKQPSRAVRGVNFTFCDTFALSQATSAEQSKLRVQIHRLCVYVCIKFNTAALSSLSLPRYPLVTFIPDTYPS